MSVRVISLDELSKSDRNAWARIVATDAALSNPFLHPAFAEAAHQTLGPVHVALAARHGRAAGFLAFQKANTNATPVAEGLNEQQAFVAESRCQTTGAELVKAVGVPLRFDHLIAEQVESLGVWTSRQGGSPLADLTNGFDHYLAERRASGSSTVRATQRKARKLEREQGDLRFQFDDESQDAFDCLIRWKREQHDRTGVVDLFADRRVVRFLAEIRHSREDGFRARLSSLRVKDQVVAVHLGLFTQRTGHVWYPAYDNSFAAYSPGLILLLELMEAMSHRSIGTLDFGPGPQRYKRSFSNAERPVCIGVIDRSPIVAAMRRAAHHAKRLARQTPLASLRQWTLPPFSQQQASPHV